MLHVLSRNRTRCNLYGEILDVLDEENVSGACSGRFSLSIRLQVLQRLFEKVSRSLKYDSNFFGPQTHNWASEASPTLGCSIEVSRDMYRISSNSFRGIYSFQVLPAAATKRGRLLNEGGYY